MNLSYQKLVTLNLQSNQIGETGAFYLSDGLRYNKVKNEIPKDAHDETCARACG